MKQFPFKPMLAVGIAALTLSTAAIARPPFGGHGGDVTIADVEAKHAERISKVDSDGNGLISEAEFLAAKHSRKGGPGMHGGPGGPRHGGRTGGGPMGPDFEFDPEAIEDSVFVQLDADQNGTLSRTEFSREKVGAARGTAMRKAIFAELDTNQDGSLSADELPDPMERLRTLDTDGDGKVTRAERKAHWQNRRGSGGDSAPAGTGG